MSSGNRDFYSFEPFRLDPSRRVLSRDGAPVHVSSKAFETLLVLVRNAGDVVVKADLLAAVWPDTVVEENNLTQSVSALRKALGEPKGDPRFIVTVSGRGYCFVAPVTRHARDEEARPEAPAERPAPAPLSETVATADGVERPQPLSVIAALLAALAFGLSVWVAVSRSGGERRTPGPVAASGRTATADHIDARGAREAYLRGRYFLGKQKDDSLLKAVASFREAATVDAAFAPALAGLADAYLLLGEREADVAVRRDHFARARDAATRAVRLNDALAEAHTSLAAVIDLCDGDVVGAEREFLRALELDPTYAPSYYRYSDLLVRAGRIDEAERAARSAHAQDPLSIAIGVALGECLIATGRYDEAIAHLERTLELDPESAAAHVALGLAYDAKGSFDRAIAEFERARPTPAFEAAAGAAIVHACATSRWTEEAERLAQELWQRSKTDTLDPYDEAILRLGLGDEARAVAALRRAHATSASARRSLAIDPRLEPIRSSAHYRDLFAR